jgi:hypothetical protein
MLELLFRTSRDLAGDRPSLRLSCNFRFANNALWVPAHANREILADPSARYFRILRLTKEDEKKLIARIGALASYTDLQHVQERTQVQPGPVLQIRRAPMKSVPYAAWTWRWPRSRDGAETPGSRFRRRCAAILRSIRKLSMPFSMRASS